MWAYTPWPLSISLKTFMQTQHICVPHRAQLIWLHPPLFSRSAPHPGHGFTPCSSRQRRNDSFPPDAAAHPPADDVGALGLLKRQLGLHYTTLRNTPGGSGHGRLFDQSKRLARRYHGRPWDGKTIVFLAQSPEKELRRGWGPFLTGSWRQVEVTGDHYTMIRTPWVYEVADLLLDEWD